MNEDLVSIKRLAQILDCSPKTVRDWMYRNRKTLTADPLPYYRLGGLVRFRLSDVMGWIDRRRVRISPLAAIRSGVRGAPR
jgi:excisionase family DNA binding protein